jgi:hypothetical protein
MYNSGNSSKNVTGASVVDGTVETVDIADDAVTADKLANSVNTDIGTGVTASTTAGDALPKAGGAMTGAITTNSTFDGVDVATRDGVLTTTTSTANDALPKAGGTMTGTIAGFTSTGIDDNATSTAITINASEQVIIGDTDANVKSALTVSSNASGNAATFIHDGAAGTYFDIDCGAAGGSVDLRADAVSGAYPALTFKTSASERMRIEAGGNVEVSTGNLVIGTSGKGIDFSADGNAAGATSEVLDDYEEGTWTPMQGGGVTVVGTFTSSGSYVKVGNVVHAYARLQGSTSIAVATNGVLTDLPFNINQSLNNEVPVPWLRGSLESGVGYAWSTRIYATTLTTVAASGSSINCRLTYRV